MAIRIPTVKAGDWNGLRRTIHSLALSVDSFVVLTDPETIARLFTIPEFQTAVLSDVTANRLVATDPDQKLIPASLSDWIQASGEVEVADNEDGTVTLSVTGGSGIVEVEDMAGRQSSDSRVVYQRDVKKLYLRRT